MCHVEDLLEQLPVPAGYVPVFAFVAPVQQAQAAHEADGDLLAEQQRELGLAGGHPAPGCAAGALGDQAPKLRLEGSLSPGTKIPRPLLFKISNNILFVSII